MGLRPRGSMAKEHGNKGIVGLTAEGDTIDPTPRLRLFPSPYRGGELADALEKNRPNEPNMAA